MNKRAGISTGLLVKLIGAVVGSIGFFFAAFGRTIVGAAFIGLGGVLLALGEKVG
ncbi:MAG: hypothetical protein AABX13_04880 [Nanoarchaeota archaeon]